MEKYITQNGIKYELRGKQYYPMLEISEQEEHKIGKYGLLHRDYIKQHKRGTYTTLLTEGKLNAYLYMGNASKDYNKAAYDRLIAHRSKIESVLGVSLIWNRGDDIKSCKVSYQIDNVSIENETDWLQMAKFHAEWSKKFYDVIVPYLV